MAGRHTTHRLPPPSVTGFVDSLRAYGRAVRGAYDPAKPDPQVDGLENARHVRLNQAAKNMFDPPRGR